MSRRPTTVRQLAIDAGLDFDEALVTLWDNGFDDVMDLDDRIPASRVSKAQGALGLDTLRQMRTTIYWERKLGLDRTELQQRLAAVGISLTPGARVLPKGALAKLRRLNMTSTVASPLELPSDSLREIEEQPLPEEPPLVWRTIGRTQRHGNLTTDEVVQIHEALEDEFANTSDAIEPPGVMDMGLLKSAVFRADTSLGGENKYTTAEMASAALMHSIVHNHAFYNGNKRTALVSLLVALDRENVLVTCSERDLFRFVLRVAQHRLVSTTWRHLSDREVLAAAEWICENSRPLERGERLLKWRQLRRVLSNWDCELEGPIPGNRMRIRRTWKSRGRLGISKTRRQTFVAWYGGEGREVAPTHVKQIRQALELDDEHGVDSGYFYGTDPSEPDDFIARHRKLLSRLAKL